MPAIQFSRKVWFQVIGHSTEAATSNCTTAKRFPYSLVNVVWFTRSVIYCFILYQLATEILADWSIRSTVSFTHLFFPQAQQADSAFWLLFER